MRKGSCKTAPDGLTEGGKVSAACEKPLEELFFVGCDSGEQYYQAGTALRPLRQLADRCP